MNDKLPVFVIALCLFVGGKTVFSQTPADVVLKPGAKGIYINLGNRGFYSKNEATGITGFEIERKATKEGSYIKLASVRFPESADAFKKALIKAFLQCPYKVNEQNYPADIIWNSLRSSGNRPDSTFRKWAGYLPVRLAAGMMYLDEGAVKNTDYQYRISSVDNHGETHLITETPAAQYPQPLKLSKPQLLFAGYRDSACQMNWYMKESSASRYRLFRQDLANRPFNDVPQAFISFNRRRDTTFITIRDSAAVKGNLYYYKLVPADAWGNESIASNAFSVPVYDFRQLALPSSINIAINDTGAAGINISWKIRDTLYVKEVLLYRAEKENGKDSLVKIFTAHSTHYLDNNGISPMHYYYYRFAIRGYFNEESSKTIPFAGQYISGIRPSPPIVTKAAVVPRGIELQFHAISGHIAGFKVFRSNSAGRPLIQVSDFIPYKKDQPGFLDTTVSTGAAYGYAVQSISTSNINGPLSDTVYVRTGKPVVTNDIVQARARASKKKGIAIVPDLPLLAPQDLQAYSTGQGVQLEWTAPADTRVTAFNIYRYTRGKPAVLLVQVKQATVFLDKSAARGQQYFYYVTGTNDKKLESKPENEAGVYTE